MRYIYFLLARVFGVSVFSSKSLGSFFIVRHKTTRNCLISGYMFSCGWWITCWGSGADRKL